MVPSEHIHREYVSCELKGKVQDDAKRSAEDPSDGSQQRLQTARPRHQLTVLAQLLNHLAIFVAHFGTFRGPEWSNTSGEPTKQVSMRSKTH
jgi:hypothetical protein